MKRAKKKNNRKKLFSPYKIIDSENFIKVSQNPNKVARDTQGLPTVPHNDFGGLNFKGLASKYLLLMTLPPADDEKMKKNRTSGTPTSKKTSDSASSSKVCRTKVKLKFPKRIFVKVMGRYVIGGVCPILLYALSFHAPTFAVFGLWNAPSRRWSHMLLSP